MEKFLIILKFWSKIYEKIVLSTDNKNKVREIREILEDLDIEIFGKSDIEGLDFEVIEDGETLYDNALKRQMPWPRE